MQTPYESFLEAMFNVTVGFWIMFACQMFLFPYIGIAITFHQGMTASFLMMIVSAIRSFVFRRMFDRIIRSRINKSKPHNSE